MDTILILILTLRDIKQIDSTGEGGAFFGNIVFVIDCNNMQIADTIE